MQNKRRVVLMVLSVSLDLMFFNIGQTTSTPTPTPTRTRTPTLTHGDTYTYEH